MKIPLFFARRYFFAKKSHHIINIITGISVAGITIGTAALIIVLSVFNGFEGVVVQLFNSFNPDIKITAVEGKTFNVDSLPLQNITSLQGVTHAGFTLEENALLRYNDKQAVVTVKGVTKEFAAISRLSEMITEGRYLSEDSAANFAVIGQGIAYSMGLMLNDYENPVSLYIPRRGGDLLSADPTKAFSYELIQPSGFFSIQQDFDQKYVILPLELVRKMSDAGGEATSCEIALEPGADAKALQEQIQKIAGGSFVVKNRFQQEELLFKIMKSEKLAVFLILFFILLIAVFNVVGSISMLILDKKKDIAVLKSLGANEHLIRRIFFTEGMMITAAGIFLGLFLGAMVCWLQQTFGLITIQAGDTFVIQEYPVKMMFSDFALITTAIFMIGAAASWYPVKYISARYLTEKLG